MNPKKNNKILKIIQGFKNALKTDSEKFQLEDLQDLDQVLAALDTPTEAELEELIKTWLKNINKSEILYAHLLKLLRN